MSQAFYRKWRPQTWDEVVAQEHVIQTLRNAVRTGQTRHAYLLAGPRGTGKTTTARLLAKALNCLDPDPAKRPCDQCEHCKSLDEGRFLDLVEIDAASNTSVDDVRDLRDKINYRPTQGEYKVYIIDEVHMLSTAAFNALLKTLEEPPPHAVFILATTEVHKIPATILSRCQRYEFRRIPVKDIVDYLRKMAAEEKIQVEDDALQLIARQATGAMRDAISLLDQLASTGERVTLAEAQVVLGTATSNLVIDLVEAVLSRDAARGLKIVQSALDAGTDARQFARQVVDYLRNLLLVRSGNADQVDATREMRDQLARHAQQFEPRQLLEAIRLFNNAATDARSSWHPGLALELALAEAIEPPAPAAPASHATAETPVGRASVTDEPAPTRRTNVPPQQEEPVGRVSATNVVGSPAGPASNSPTHSTTDPASNSPTRSTAEPASKSPAHSTADPAPTRKATVPAQPEEPAGRVSKTPAEPPAAGGKAITQQEVQQNWPAVKRAVKKRNALTEGLLNSARSIVLKENTLLLGFQSEVVKSKMETKENLELLRQAIQSVFGVPLNVRCGVVGNRSGQASDLDVDGDGMVGTALDLGGKIVYEE